MLKISTLPIEIIINFKKPTLLVAKIVNIQFILILNFIFFMILSIKGFVLE